MPNSSDVSAGDNILASQYNNLRKDIFDKDTGHTHTGETDKGYPVPAVGSIIMFGGSTAPEGWLICDGSAISRTTYSRLFNVIGTTFGAGDGSTTFNLPNLQNRFPMGKSGTKPLGSTGGNSGLYIDWLNSHHHSIPYSGAIAEVQPAGGGTQVWRYDPGGTDWDTGNTGNSVEPPTYDITNPYQAVNYIIKY